MRFAFATTLLLAASTTIAVEDEFAGIPAHHFDSSKRSPSSPSSSSVDTSNLDGASHTLLFQICQS
jgi:hypothetical protein